MRDRKLNTRRSILVCLILILAILTVFVQVISHNFVGLDDDIYVAENRLVKAGLNFKSIIWAFTATHASNWHPLTWLSHMLDISLFGLNPGWHHLINLFFHIANTLLLFLILKGMTEEFWKSAFVAALFALHPLHVESVAWIAERKDVLSTFFWMLTILAYAYYVKHPVLKRYLLILFCFILGLMSKPMLVTLPFVLLLLDYWPLKRLQFVESGNRENSNKKSIKSSHQEFVYLIWEKVPFFALAFISSIVTFLAQQYGGAVKPLEIFSLKIRVANALISYVAYIGKMFWPSNLAVLYPHLGNNLPIWGAIGAGLLLVFVSVLVIRFFRKLPYLTVGWLWYLGTLVPVIGLVQVGSQSMADRYTYIPLIGIFIMIAWGVPDIVKRLRYKKILLSLSSAVLLSIILICTWIQVGYWKDSIALLEHTLSVTSKNYLAHNNLGVVLARRGKLKEAIFHYHEALKIKPDDIDTHNNLGFALAQQGRLEEAISHFQEAIKINPDNEYAQTNLGIAMAQQERLEEAIFHFKKALEVNPDNENTRRNLAVALIHQGKIDDAISHLKEIIRINPNNETTHKNLAMVYISQGKLDEAIFHLREMIRINPNDGDTHNNLGVFLARQGNLKEAIFHFEEALRINPDNVDAQSNLESVLMTLKESQ